MVLAFSVIVNIIFLYYLIHDEKYYKKLIKDLQGKYKKALDKINN
jgi:hypothetical protein